jgi:inner membrane protein
VDNLTHTLISVVVGDALHRAVPASAVLSEKARRNVAIAVMAVGGNLPDADLLQTALGGGKLDYLLDHRGHTHTLVGVLGLGLVLFAAVRLWWRHRGVRPAAADVGFLAGIALLAPLLHLGLDFTNSYGVHPFWPVDDRWYYGDAVFIVEPLLWACAAPLLFTLRSRWTRGLVGLVLAAGVGLAWGSGLVPPAFAALLTLLVVGLAIVARTASARTALATGIVAWLAVTTVFVVTGRAADARVAAVLAEASPAARTLDVVLTPAPSNPVCREVLTVQVVGDRYVARSGTHSLLPGWLPAAECARFGLGGTPTAPLVATLPATDEVVWRGELSLARDLPATLAQDYCAVSALLQFARVPFAVERGDGWLVGDLRYDSEPEPGFAEVEVGPGRDECPAYRPPWVPPRQDLLGTG